MFLPLDAAKSYTALKSEMANVRYCVIKPNVSLMSELS